ncbi:MAG: trigger factor, partial [Pseudomonadota bacterium]|nr:trigger factor [Pseudomonadota bacterium]
YGEQVRAEILDGLLRQGFDNAIREQTFRIAGNPQIVPSTEAAGEGELAYVATFEVVPDFGEIEVEKLAVARHTAEVEDADIDRMVENLRTQRRTWQPVERGAKEGDLVELEMFSEVDGERLPAEGVEKGSTVIGSGMMFAAIESALADMAGDEKKTVKVDFPSDWPVPQLAGKSADVHVHAVHV